MNRKISLFLTGCLFSAVCLHAQKATAPMLTLSKKQNKVNMGIKEVLILPCFLQTSLALAPKR